MKYNEEVLSKKGILSEEEYEQELVNKINELEKEYNRLLKLDFAAEELYNKKTFKRQVKKIKPKIKNIKQKLRLLQKELDEYGYEGSIYNNISYFVIELDYLLKSNTYNSFYKLKTEKDPKKKLKLYRKVFVSLIQDYNELDMKDYKHKRITNNIINLMRCKIYKEKAKVRRLMQIESVKEKAVQKTISENIVEEQRDYIDITDSFVIKNEDIKEVMYSFRNMVKKAPITPNFLDYVSIIRSRLNNEEEMDENYDLINSIIDYIKYRKMYLKKRDKKEKDILRLCSNELKELSNQIMIRNIPFAEEHDYKFDMVIELLKDKNNYGLIKKIVEDYPVVVNVRNNKRSILSYILQLYINNYMMILKEHKYNFNIDYLKEVYKLFSSSSSLYLSYEDKAELDSILDEFMYNLSDLDINSRRKNYAISEANELYLDNMNNDNNYHKKVDKAQFDRDIDELIFLDPNHSNRTSDIDLTHENTFMLNNPFVCYSYVEEKGVEKLKIHTADFSNIIEEGSTMEKYVYNCMLDNKKINKTLSDYLTFKKDDIVSALTYEIVFNKDRDVKSFNIYKSRIKIDGDILDYDRNMYVYKNLRKIVTDYIQKNGDNNLSGLCKIEYILTDMMNKQYIKLTRNNNLPIIAYKEEKVPAIDNETLSRVKYLFNKLHKRDLKKLTKIFDSKIEDKYYDDRTRYDEKNELNICGDPNYIYLLNQRMIKLLLLNDRQITPDKYPMIKQRVIDEYDDTIKVLNDVLGHKDEAEFDYKMRRNFKTYSLRRED